MHSTNYINAFIGVADDCKARSGIAPSPRPKPSVAELEFRLLSEAPYQLTSDQLKIRVEALRRDLKADEIEPFRDAFFSRGQPCFRASPLARTYGWGAHFDAEGRMAIYGVETDEYRRYAADTSLEQRKAMRGRK